VRTRQLIERQKSMSERLRELRENKRGSQWDGWDGRIPADNAPVETHEDAADYAGRAAQIDLPLDGSKSPLFASRVTYP
jgi:hypothetical protein